ncbi:MAG: T9SS type A sorting domain-containing protein [Bacteroidales bacterium]|nr:T9SS type A sorting domain-containing protein [Bacteroidales bacterium]
MKTKTTLLIFITTLLISLFAAKTNAQIVYTELNPYVLIEDTIREDDEPEYYNLDLNNDGSIDFDVWIIWTLSQLSSVNVRSVGFIPIDTTVAVAINQQNNIAERMDIHSLINNELTWINYANITICAFAIMINYPCPMGDKYYGLKIIKDTFTFYGWVRIESTLEQAIIKDYAYNATPGAQILAGQTSLNIQNTQQNYLDVFVQNKVLLINFNNNLLPNGTVKVLNTNGTAVLNNQITSTNNQINLSHLTAGIYFVNIETTYGIYNKKIFIQ